MRRRTIASLAILSCAFACSFEQLPSAVPNTDAGPNAELDGNVFGSDDSSMVVSDSAPGVTDAGPSVCVADMTGYDPTSSWPLAGRCPDRSNVAFAKGPHAPTIKWTYSRPGSYFGKAAIGANDTVIAALQAKGDSSGFVGRVLSVHAGTLVWDTALTGESGATSISPTLAADGSVLILGEKGLYSLSATTGALKWSVPFASSSLFSPIILGNKTIVALGSNAVRGFSFGGAPLWTYSVAKGTISRDAVVGAAGEIVFPVRDGAAGIMIAISSSGQELWKTPISGFAIENPVISSTGTVYVPLFASVAGLSLQGVVTFQNSTTFTTLSSAPVQIGTSLSIFSELADLTVLDEVKGSFKSVDILKRNYCGLGTNEGDLIYYSAKTPAPQAGTITARKTDGTNRWSLPVVSTNDESNSITMSAAGIVYMGIAGTLIAVGD